MKIAKGRWYVVHPNLTTDPNNRGKGLRGQRVYVRRVEKGIAYVSRHRYAGVEAQYDVDVLVPIREFNREWRGFD